MELIGKQQAVSGEQKKHQTLSLLFTAYRLLLTAYCSLLTIGGSGDDILAI
jgi:hypothetical protein